LLKGACDRDSSFYVMYKDCAIVSITTRNDVKEIKDLHNYSLGD